VVVAGLGVMGAAAARELARRGRTVIGLDRFRPPHREGSSHGRTRIIREAYFEHPMYVPLVQRAYELWADAERATGRRLLVACGGLMMGEPHGPLVAGSLRSAQEHHLAHEMLDAAEVRRRFPAFTPDEGMVALLEPRAGMLLAEDCVQSLLDLAAADGAELRMDEPVQAWETSGEGVAVRTSAGRIEAGALVIAAGSRLPALLGLDWPLQVERQLLHWFEPHRDAARLAAPGCPIALIEPAPGRLFATFPDLGDGVKCGIHHEGEDADPDRLRPPDADDEARSRELLARYLPGANGPLRDAMACRYTNTPDRHFVIDRHPRSDRVVVLSPCSGHGFKFGAAVGEVAADLVTEGRSRFDLTPFSAARFLPSVPRVHQS
jgi:sarcosine oxidase